MNFIGIITNSKSEKAIKQLLHKNKSFKENNVIFINEKNIDNIKNVYFNTVVVNKEFNKMKDLNRILENASNVIINMDIDKVNNNMNITNSNIITFGFNSKSSITVSSVTDDDVLICVQRNISRNRGEIEVQEIRLENNNKYNIYDLIIVLILILMYISTKEAININGIK